jgi:RNA-directed DNA polymerase
MKPGNSGGGKAPDFWYAFEKGEDRVIGESLQTPLTIGSLSRKLCVKVKGEKAALPSRGTDRSFPICVRKPLRR